MDEMELDELEEGQGGGLDLKVLVLYGIARSRYIVGFLALVGTAAGLLMAASKPNTYQSVARLHFLAGKREGITPEIVAGLDDSWAPSIGITDEIVLLEDPEIYEHVAVDLGVERVLAKPDPAAEDGPDTAPHVRLLHSIQSYMNSSGEPCPDPTSKECIRAAGMALKSRTIFNPVRRSNVIEVYHESTSPEQAQEFAQSLVEAFVQRHRETFSAQPHADDTERDMLGAQDRFQEAVERYREHRKLCGFQSLGEETAEIRQQILDLRSQLVADRARRTQVLGELEQYEKYLAEIPEFVDRVTPAVKGPNQDYEFIRRERFQRQLELWLVGEEAVLSERERKKAIIQGQIERLTEQLAQMDPLVEVAPEVVEKVPNTEYFEYKRLVDSRVAEDGGLALTIQEKEKSLNRLLEQLDLAGECEKHHDHWERRIKDTEDDYTKLKERHYQLRSLSALDAEGESNLRIYQAALLPTSKSGPKRAKTVLMGAFGGLAAGIGIAVLRQLVEGRVRYGRTLENQLKLPVLAVVPEAAALRKLAKRRAVSA